MDNLNEKKLKTVKNNTPVWTLKPVIHINTGIKFNSLSEAADQVYHNKRRYNEISEVCKDLKEDYKCDIWRFEEDYILLSDKEKKALKDKCIKLNTPKIKVKTKLLYKDKTFNSFRELGLILFQDGLLSYRTNSSADLGKVLLNMIKSSKNINCPFIILNSNSQTEYIFFADYEITYKSPTSTYKKSEAPVNKTVEEICNFYIGVLDKNIGDMKIVDLLTSSKLLFYKLDEMYFKSASIIKEYAYDETITKAQTISLIDNPDYTFIFDTTELYKTKRDVFYVKNRYVFMTKYKYINTYKRVILKEDIIKELNLIY